MPTQWKLLELHVMWLCRIADRPKYFYREVQYYYLSPYFRHIAWRHIFSCWRCLHLEFVKKMNSIGWYLVKIKSECLTHFKRGEHPQPTYPVTNYRTNVVGDYFTIPLILSSFKSWSTFWITRIERKRLKMGVWFVLHFECS